MFHSMRPLLLHDLSSDLSIHLRRMIRVVLIPLELKGLYRRNRSNHIHDAVHQPFVPAFRYE